VNSIKNRTLPPASGQRPKSSSRVTFGTNGKQLLNIETAKEGAKVFKQNRLFKPM